MKSEENTAQVDHVLTTSDVVLLPS